MRTTLAILFSFCTFYTQAQDNPYAIFGYKPKVILEDKSDVFTVKNADKNSNIKEFIVDADKREIKLVGENGETIKHIKMQPSEVYRFLAVDPLANSYRYKTPYDYAENQPVRAVDLDGLEAKIVITNQPTGFTYQRVAGAVPSSGLTVPVRTYRVNLIDAQHPDKIIATGNVTRNSWYSRGQKSNGQFELTNRSFEPSNSNVNLYTGVPTEYPHNSNLDAFVLTQKGSDKLNAEPFTKVQNTMLDGDPINEARSNLGIASGIMFHIGGFYQNEGGDALAASYGCFGFIGEGQVYQSQSDVQNVINNGNIYNSEPNNKEYSGFIKQVINVRDRYRGTKNEKTLISVEKRENVPSSTTVSN